ncbi:MAG: integrin alpha [Sandaracinaceae bacterium]|nr:integrin alpha [Sandaracinaceae bacterium]
MAGEVRIYLGDEAGIGDAASFVLTGAVAGARFGFSVAWAGDLNADGYADLAVGAPDTAGAGGMQVGSAFVFYGSPGGPSAAPDATLVGINSGGGFFGHSVAGMGDGNGDGYDELAVGAFGVNSRTGRVSVFLGGAAGLVTTTRTNVEGPFGANGDFGWSLASAGDVDANGRDDLVVGSPGVDDRTGRAHVFRGATAGGVSMTPLVDLLGASGGSFGRAVATVGR